MHIVEGYYGDFKALDELPFSLNSLSRAEYKVAHEYNVEVGHWPMTIDYIENTGYWEVWFTPPVSDEEYVERMHQVSPEL